MKRTHFDTIHAEAGTRGETFRLLAVKLNAVSKLVGVIRIVSIDIEYERNRYIAYALFGYNYNGGNDERNRDNNSPNPRTT